jgi:uncharacterized membrane protein
VFGRLINFLSLSRIDTRGLESAHKKMVMAACAYNLKKWLNYCSGSRKKAALIAPRPAVTTVFWLFWVKIWSERENYRRMVLGRAELG